MKIKMKTNIKKALSVFLSLVMLFLFNIGFRFHGVRRRDKELQRRYDLRSG